MTIKHETAYPPVLNKVDYNYDRNRYTLTVNANGGTYSGSTSQELKYEQSITLANPIKTGYNFTNWTATSGRIEGSSFTIGASDATVTANYTPKQFTVTFNANGGSTPTASKIVSYDSTYGDLPTPTYNEISGYTFKGWFTSSSGGTQVTESSIVSVTNDQILYAQWNPVVFNVPQAVTAIINNQTVKGVKAKNPIFATAATTNEGVYSMADDYGTSYYYRGAVTNNYVKFGGFYWRIIRINGDGSLRMIYDGTQAWPNGNGQSTFTTSGTDRFTHTGKAWNTNYNDAKYVGWMFGGDNGSTSTSKGASTKK
ncbi:MAG TPA: hypothetical protein DCY94_02015 [Firmicutes bacterium]|nr:hypothetical protein [Bacillota bacterium]